MSKTDHVSDMVELQSDAVAALDELERAFTVVQRARLEACTDDEIAGLTRRWETLRNRMATVDAALVGQLTVRGIPGSAGCKNTAAYLRYALRITPAEARRRVRAAQRFGRRVEGCLVLDPVYGPTADALAAGVVSPEHARVIADTVEALPAEVALVERPRVEAALLDAAQHVDPHELGKAGERIRYLLDQDGRLADTDRHDRNRQVRFSRRPDGTGRIEGDLTAEAAELLETAFDALAKPAPAADGTPDPRSPGQRRHDALAELARLAMRARLLPNAGGVTATVIVHMSPDSYVTGEGTATTGHGYTVPAHVAKRWTDGGGAAEARIIAVLLSKTKRVEAYSCTHRIFTEQQRLAMMARDFGCSFPHCASTALHTEAHHIVEWQHDGDTTVSNGTLVCDAHHDQFAKMGWQTISITDVPYWRPPPWIDPTQTPIRKTDHDL